MGIQSGFTQYSTYSSGSVMIRYISYIVFSLVAWCTQAQWIISPLEHDAEVHSRSARTVSASVTLPFWDDFSTSSGSPDSTKWEAGSDVFVNATLGRNPPTKNVATFDGLTAAGLAHNISATFSGPADSLVSKPIDLTTVSSRNTVYLSFFWQAKGNGEIPDDEDSLVVQFLTRQQDSLVWEWRWGQIGGLENVRDRFTFEDLKIPAEDKYFHDQFRIKFTSYNSLTGPFDTWNIDYVYLNENRHKDDSVFVDRSIIGSTSRLFGDYNSVPLEVFLTDPSAFIHQEKALVSNVLFNATQNTTNFTYQIRNENAGDLWFERIYSNKPHQKPGTITEIPGPTPSDISLNISPVAGDSLVLSTSFFYTTGDYLHYEFPAGDTVEIYYPTMDLRVNDTLKNYYTLQNYYAYDDGTAEFATGISSKDGQVAVRYTAHEADTLTHLDVYFPNIAPSSSGKTIDIIVWKELSEAGERSRQSYTIQAPQSLNQFARIGLFQPILVKDTFYVGYKQSIDDYIGVGFDRSNPAAGNHMFSNVNSTWVQNTSLAGALMIRPVFGHEVDFILDAPPPQMPVTAFPNPSNGSISFTGKYDQVVVTDLSGKKLLMAGYIKDLNLQFLEDGIYLLRISNNNSIYTQKLIIRK